jgi:hypothetical protein
MCLRFSGNRFWKGLLFRLRICLINVEIIALEKEERFVGHDDFLRWQEYGFTKALNLFQEYLL